MGRHGKWLAAFAGAAALGATSWRAGAAQVPLTATPAGSVAWTIARDPFAELWFQSMAVVGVDVREPLPMYDVAFRERARTRFAVSTVARRAAEYRRAFAEDPAFEVLHFVPLYFTGYAPDAVLQSLLAAARPGWPHPIARDFATLALARGADAVVSTLSSTREREALAAFVEAILDDGRQRTTPPVASLAAADSLRLARSWQQDFAPLLEPLFAAARVGGGSIVIVPGLGPEGRVIRRGAGDVLVIVGTDFDSRDAAAPLFAVVRELTFLVLHRSTGQARPSVADERESDVVATHAAGIILDRLAPQLAARYRAVFTRAAGRSARSFGEAFPLDAAHETALRLELAAALHAADSR